MQNLQQTVFSNFHSKTPYNFQSKKLTQKHALYPKYRYQQLQNQFELVDLHDSGYLSQQQIIQYLSDKYQWVNEEIIRNLFGKMGWVDRREIVQQQGEGKLDIQGQNNQQLCITKKQFCQKYLEHQKKLYHQINGLKYCPSWIRTLQEIYQQQMRAGVPRSYFYFQIKKVELYHEGKQMDWVDLKFNYENHDKKVTYEIQEASYDTANPSFEIWLPSQKNHFFLKFLFTDMEDPTYIYGQSYFNLQLEEKMLKKKSQELPIMKTGKKVGVCQVQYRLEPNLQIVREQLRILKQRQSNHKQTIDQKTKQYEYLQFLWGIRQISPHKVAKLDTFKIIIFRVIMLLLLGLLGIVCNVLGRCEPVSIILAFILIKNYQLVMLREEKFYVAWICVAGILLDLVWLAIASDSKSQINFMDLGWALFLTYPLLVVKAIFFVYMLIYEKAFISRDGNQR